MDHTSNPHFEVAAVPETDPLDGVADTPAVVEALTEQPSGAETQREVMQRIEETTEPLDAVLEPWDEDEVTEIVEPLPEVPFGQVPADDQATIDESATVEEPISKEEVERRLDAYKTAYKTLDIAAKVAELDLEEPTNNGTLLGEGGQFAAVRLPETDMVVRVRHPEERAPEEAVNEQCEQRMEALARSEGLDHFEQPVAYSPEDQLTVTEVVPGEEIEDLTLDEITQIPDKQIDEAAKAVEEAFKHDVGIDWVGPGNTFYEEEQGITFIDQVCLSTDEPGRSSTAEEEVINFLSVLAKAAIDTAQAESENNPDALDHAMHFIETRLSPRVEERRNEHTARAHRNFIQRTTRPTP